MTTLTFIAVLGFVVGFGALIASKALDMLDGGRPAQPNEGRLLWAAQWRSRSNLSGTCEHLLNENCLPVMFLSRAAARAWIKDKFGYIATRPDLRAEPHGWKMPRAVRVRVIMTEAA